MNGFEIALPAVLLGVLTGAAYGLLAVGIVIVYRASRVVNFAQGNLGVFAASLVGLAVVRWHVPYWLAFAAALVIGGAAGLISHLAIRRLRDAPAPMSVVASLGLSEFFVLLAIVISNEGKIGGLFPQPPGLPEIRIGTLLLTGAHTGLLILSPIVVAGMAIFLRRSRTGHSLRASAANPDLARTVGISPARTAGIAWIMAGVLAAFTALFVLPTVPYAPEFFGLGLLVRALVATVIARMRSLGIAFAAGIGIGVVEQVLFWNVPRSGLVEAVLFAGLLVALLLQPRLLARGDERGSWFRVDVRLSSSLRWLGRVGPVAGFAAGAVFLGLASNTAAVNATGLAAYAIVGVGLGIVLGLGGQLSLGHWALAGVGATLSIRVTTETGNFFLGFAAAGAAAAVVGLVVAAPALRIRGPMLAVTTLAFALMAQAWLFQQPWMIGDGLEAGRPIIGGITLDTGREYAFLALLVLAGAVMFARRVWRGPLGRRLVALRDGEAAARGFGVPATRTLVLAFVLSGFIAGIGGAVYGHLLPLATSSTFPLRGGIIVAAAVAIGGVGLLTGPVLGALYIVGLPLAVPLDSAGLATSAFGWLLLILYFPGGVAQLFVRRGARDSLDPGPGAARRPASRSRPEHAGSALEALGIGVSFSGVRALRDVSLAVERGEIVGLVGPNGAGKTTLLDVCSGFVPAQEGQVALFGQDVTTRSVEARARLGLVRSFQDAPLFPTLTVVEVLALAGDLRRGAGLLRPGGSREGRRRAEAVAERFGLATLADARVLELSSGGRRVLEIACVTELAPKVVLLDEPSSGLAEAEVESLAGLLKGLRDEHGSALVLVEHHLPFVRDVADRVVALDVGKVVETAPVV